MIKQERALDVDQLRVCRGDFFQIGGDVDAVDALVVRGGLLADVPHERRQAQVLAALGNERRNASGGLLAIGSEGHVVLPDVIEDAGHFDLVAMLLELLDCRLNERDEALGEHLKTGQLRSLQNRPVEGRRRTLCNGSARQSKRARIGDLRSTLSIPFALSPAVRGQLRPPGFTGAAAPAASR